MSLFYPYYFTEQCAVVMKQPTLPMQETYSWLTDVLTSYNGIEDRSPLRSKPRVTIKHKYEFTRNEKADVFNTIYGAVRGAWIVPLWQYAQRINQQSGTTVLCDTVNYPFVLNEQVVIYSSDSSYVVADIFSLGVGTMNISASITGLTNPILIPAKIAFVNNDINLTSNGDEGFTELEFRLISATPITGNVPTQYNSNDTCYDKRLHGSGNTYKSTFISDEFLSDFALGKIGHNPTWLNTKIVQNQFVINKDLDEFKTFLNWLHRREGRYRSYWRPSFEKDLRITSTGTLTTSVDVYKDSFIDWSSNRLNIVFQDTSGNWIPKTITSVTVVDALTMRLNWSGSISLPVSNIHRLCYFGLRRLTNDAIKIDWIGGLVSRCELSDTEVSA